ncbi:MAG: hypothetical protein J0H00_08620 [Burkholderiales bacterium]|nr:hypothetical protein [Burkholderiales bacterium]OJX07742.1 MAG: hypothetical protein BGO72_18505 [Burkholderiales bacterium 70-64]
MRLSSRGAALYRKIFPRVVHIHREVLSALDEHEQQMLASCLLKMQVRALEVRRDGLVDAYADRRKGGSRRAWPCDAAWLNQAEAGVMPII